jgi:predicted dehydrogenase
MRKIQPSILNRRNFVKTGIKASIAWTILPRYVLGRGFTAPSDRINLGFIGTGKQGRGLANSFAPKAQIVAGADVDSKKLALFQTIIQKFYAETKGLPDYKGFTAYPDFRELLGRKDIDAVVIATPDHWHAACCILASNAGKHLYCEKPLAHSVVEGRAMVRAVHQNKVVLQTGSMQRSWKTFHHACELVRNGYLGDIREVWVSVGSAAIADDLEGQNIPSNLNWDFWVGPAPFKPFNAELSPPVEQDIFPNWRKYKEYGGGILSDWGAHMFDIAQWGLGMDKTGPIHFFPPDGNQYKTLTMVYENGIIMKHLDFGRGYGVRFIGSKGSLDISREYLDSKPENIATALIQPTEIQLYESIDHYQDWLDAIKTGKTPICDVETGHRTASVCALANIAYWLKRPLTWNPRKEEFKNDNAAGKYLEAEIRDPWKLETLFKS